jgi:hypothetical protein
MNERIKQLLIQSEVFNKDGTVLKDVCGYELNKFAELIVRECMKICQDHPSIIFKNEWDADVVSIDIVHRLESHFGVEE